VSYTVGLDWGNKQHLVCVLDGTGAVKKRLSIEHSRQGLERLLRELRKIAPPQELPVAVERPSGVLVDTLLEAGHPVIPIHPNAVKASRTRYRANTSKSDPHDAYVLADLLRTDGHRFTPVRPWSDEMRAVRTLARARDDLVRHKVMLSNQLLATLERAWPGGAKIFADLASEAGVAPVTRASGKSRGVSGRYACNKRLKRALTTWANNSRFSDPWAKRIYDNARARGCRCLRRPPARGSACTSCPSRRGRGRCGRPSPRS
jgi:transposase